MTDAPDGRQIFIWHGKTPAEDAARLTDAVAELAIAELFELNGGLMWLDGDQVIPVTKDILRNIITANFVSIRLVNRGTADKPEYQREFYSFDFPLASDISKEPNERVLIDMITALLTRVVRGPSAPREVPESQHQAIRDRVRMGEPANRVAAAYNTDVATVQRLAR